MTKAKSIVRILLGIMLLIFGLNGIFQFMPMPEAALPAQDFMGALLKTGYIMYIVAFVKIIAGLMLVSNKYVSLALVVVCW